MHTPIPKDGSYLWQVHSWQPSLSEFLWVLNRRTIVISNFVLSCVAVADAEVQWCACNCGKSGGCRIEHRGRGGRHPVEKEPSFSWGVSVLSIFQRWCLHCPGIRMVLISFLYACYLSLADSDLVKAPVTIPKSGLPMVSARTALLFLLPHVAVPLELVM